MSNNIKPTTRKNVPFSVVINQTDYQRAILNTLGEKELVKKFTAAITSGVTQNPQLSTCTPMSVISAALIAETLKLAHSSHMGHYYLVPYETKNGKVAQFQIGYKGYIQLAIRTGQYKNINVVPIKEGELVSFNPITEESVFKAIEDPLAREKAKTIGYYAFFKLLNGFEKGLYWSREKMQNHAETYSPAYKGKSKDSFWHKDFDAMACKTMIRQLLSKWGMLSVEIITAYQADMAEIKEDGTFNYIDSTDEELTGADIDVVEQADPFDTQTGEVIDADHEDKLKQVQENYNKKKAEAKGKEKELIDDPEKLAEAFAADQKDKEDKKQKDPETVDIKDL